MVVTAVDVGAVNCYDHRQPSLCYRFDIALFLALVLAQAIAPVLAPVLALVLDLALVRSTEPWRGVDSPPVAFAPVQRSLRR